MKDLDYHIELGNVSNIMVFKLMRSLYAVGLLNPELTSSLVKYIVKRGYDHEDLMNMSS